MATRPAVAVIVPAYNAEATIGPCLSAITSAMQPGDELIVYDDGATDRTNAIAVAAGAQVVRNTGSPKGPAHGRNAASAIAQLPLLLFVDADVVVAPDTIDRLAAEIGATGAAAAFGSYDDHPQSQRATSLYANLRHHFVHQNGAREATTFWSGIGMIDRQVFADIGGYDAVRFAHPSIEDIDLGVRLKAQGHRIRLVPDAQGTHCKDWSLWRVWHTDVVRRAWPWSRLIASGQTAGVDLNVATGERITAVIALSMPVLLSIGVFAPMAFLGAAAAMIAYVLRNRRFFGFLARRLKPLELLTAVAMHWCYHIYASATFAIALIATRAGLLGQLRA